MRSAYLVLLVVVVGCVNESLAVSKEYVAKKKSLTKNRSELASNDTAPVSSSLTEEGGGGVEVIEKEKEEILVAVEDQVINENTPDKDKSPAADEEDNADKDESAVEAKPPAKPKPQSSYLATRIRGVIRRVLEILGLQRQKRKSRMMDVGADNSLLGSENGQYTEEVRATVGAILGQRDCLKRAACGAGAYLRSVKGKEVLIVLLEKFSPTSWAESVNMIKEAAIYKDPCNYECE